MPKKEKPEYLEEEHLEYLDLLRESGVTNMFVAPIYLQAEYHLTISNAEEIFMYWMQTFAQRQDQADERSNLEDAAVAARKRRQ